MATKQRVRIVPKERGRLATQQNRNFQGAKNSLLTVVVVVVTQPYMWVKSFKTTYFKKGSILLHANHTLSKPDVIFYFFFNCSQQSPLCPGKVVSGL